MLEYVLLILPVPLLIVSWLGSVVLFFSGVGEPERRARRERWRADGACEGCGYPRAGLPNGPGASSAGQGGHEPVCPECGFIPRASASERHSAVLSVASTAVIGASAAAGYVTWELAHAGRLHVDGLLMVLPSLGMLTGQAALFAAWRCARHLPAGRRMWLLGIAAVLQVVCAQTWASFHFARLASMG